jgi:hypothetical protein
MNFRLESNPVIAGMRLHEVIDVNFEGVMRWETVHGCGWGGAWCRA